jgi:hypothetical protein
MNISSVFNNIDQRQLLWCGIAALMVPCMQVIIGAFAPAARRYLATRLTSPYIKDSIGVEQLEPILDRTESDHQVSFSSTQRKTSATSIIMEFNYRDDKLRFGFEYTKDGPREFTFTGPGCGEKSVVIPTSASQEATAIAKRLDLPFSFKNQII